MSPVVHKVQRRNGVAGQVSYIATVQYDCEDAHELTFVGSVYGGPVVAIMPSGAQTFVTDSGRFGTFGPEWVRRFFGEQS